MRTNIKIIISAVLVLFSPNLLLGQCTTNIVAVRNTIACGESLLLTTILPLSSTGTGFDSGVLDPTFFDLGFSNLTGMVGATTCTEPAFCTTPNTTPPIFWFPGGNPGNLTTQPLDVSCPGFISFDYRAETQSSMPCDGPDLPNEGMYFEYIVDTPGVTPSLSTAAVNNWTLINYFLPVNSGGNATHVCWTNWNFPIPAGAISSSTRFRWYTTNTSMGGFDQWGMDNISLALNAPCGNPYIASYSGGNIPSPYNFDTITVSPVTDSTVYYVSVTNGGIPCTDTFTVYVEQPTIVTTFLNSACAGSDTLDAQATIPAHCDYTLELLNFNPGGASTGWSTGAIPASYHKVDVNIDGSAYTDYSMVTGGHGATISFPIPVTDGDLLETYFYSLGSYANECAYRIYDSQGNQAFTGVGNQAFTGVGAVPMNTFFNTHLQFNITNGGSGYNTPPYTIANPAPIITLTGGGCLVDTIYANSVNFTTGVITSVISKYKGITNGATGCTSVPTITVTGGGGSGAQITASLIDDGVHVTCPATATYNYTWSNITSGGVLGLSDPNVQNPLATVGISTDFQVIAYDSLHPLCIAIDTVNVPGNAGIATFDFNITSANPLCSDGTNVIDFEIISSTNAFTPGPFYCELIAGATILPITFPSLPFTGSLPPVPLIAGSYNFDITTIYNVFNTDSCPIYPTTNPSIDTLVINDPPDAGITITNPIDLCQNQPIGFYLPNAIIAGPSTDLNGIWSCVTPGNPDLTLPFNGFNYQLDPSILPAGNWLYQYTVNALPGCSPNDSSQTTVISVTAPTAGILPDTFSVCLNGPTLDLNSLFNATASCPSCTQPSPFSGTNWTDITLGGLITPIGGGNTIANINTWMPPGSGTYILRYTANPSATCPFQDTEEVVIIVNNPPSATIGTSDLDDKVCLNELVNLDFNIVGNIGNYNISYLDETGTPQNVLVDENSNLITTGNPIPIPTGTALGHTYTIIQIEDVNTGCIDITSSQVTLTVVSPPSAGATTNPIKCEDDFTIYNLNDPFDIFFPTGGDLGGAWTFGVTPILGGIFQAADNFGNSVDPFGVYTYTVTDLSGVCPDSSTNINIIPEIPPNTGNALSNISICDNDLTITNYDLSQLLDGSEDPGGTWSYNGGVVLNPIDLSGFSSAAVPYTFTYELNPAAGSDCTNNGNLPYTTICNLTINPEPQIDPASLVINPNPVTQGVNATITVGMSVGLWPFTVYLSGNEPLGTYGNFAITSGMIGSGTITPEYDQTLPGGVVTVTIDSVTDNNGCSTSQIELTTVVVIPYPVITATTNLPSICEENLTNPLTPLDLILEATQGVPDIEISFSINGLNYFSPGDINTITALNTPTLSDIRSLLTIGTNLIQFTHVEDIGGNMCPDSLLPAPIIIEVFSTPVIDNFSSVPDPICEDKDAIIRFEFNSGVGQEPFDIIYNYTGSPNIPFSSNTFSYEDAISLVADVNNYTFNITSFTDANGCIGIPFAPFDLKVNEAPIISLNAFIPSEICETHSITLNIGTPINTSIDAPPYTVTLNGTETHFLNNDGTEISGANIGNLITFTPNNAGVYPYEITFFKDGNGCGIIDPLNNTAVLKVNETADMIVTSTADTGAICMGEKAYINLDFTAGASPWVVKFLKDGNLVTLPPYSNNNITIPQGIYKNITSYEFVSVNDSNTCINDPYNKQFDIIANSLPVVELTVDGSRYICDDGSTTNIEFNFLDGKPIYKVNYSVGLDNRYLEFNSPNPPTIPTDESGLWKITKVIDGNNCEANVLGKEVLIQVNPLPYPVEFVAYPQPADINNPFIQFIDNSVGHITAIWNFNDGAAPDTLSNNLKWLHEFDAVPDTHLVVLQVISDSGCINSTTQTVIIHEAFSCFIPNSFSPNNDLYNDFYMPITSRVQEYKLSIFDRLGNRVFETNKYSDVYCMYGCDEAWDGTVNDSGEYATTGIYIYSIEIIDHNGKERNFEGKINLVR